MASRCRQMTMNGIFPMTEKKIKKSIDKSVLLYY